MNVLFLSISSLPHMSNHAISLDLLHEFRKNNHNIYVVCAVERNENTGTSYADEAGIHVLRVKTGNNKKAGLLEKGLTTLMLPSLYISAINKYIKGVKFDLVLYPTPPITQVKTVKYIKKRDAAAGYLLLKDIFPQNSVDIGILSKTGLKGPVYRYFRKVEKELYAVSDHIGCMSQANAEYVLQHNPELETSKIEVCPNCIEVADNRIGNEMRRQLRDKYSLPQNKMLFVYGGNLGKPQDVPFIIECLKKEQSNNRVHFLIVGDGTDYQILERFFQNEKPQNASLLKRLPKEEYDLLVAACDVGLIFLDYRFTIPNFPSRLLGYMQAGLPVITCTDIHSDIGTTVSSFHFGWCCESNSTDGFSECVEQALHADLQKMGEAAFTCLEKEFSVKNGFEIIMKHFGGCS